MAGGYEEPKCNHLMAVQPLPEEVEDGHLVATMSRTVRCASSFMTRLKGKDALFDCDTALVAYTHALLVLNLLWAVLCVGYPIAGMVTGRMGPLPPDGAWFYDSMLALHDNRMLTVCVGIVVLVIDSIFYLLIRSTYGRKPATLYAITMATVLCVAALGCYSCLIWVYA